MRLGEDVLLEIIDIVRQGIVEGKDVSDMLRGLDLECPAPVIGGGSDEKIVLSMKYKANKGRVV